MREREKCSTPLKKFTFTEKTKREPDKRQTHCKEQPDIRNNSETFPSRRAALTKNVGTPKNDTHKDSTQDSYPSGSTEATTR